MSLSNDQVLDRPAVESVIDRINSGFGLDMKSDGKFGTQPSSEQLAELKKWRELILAEDGLDMPDLDTFVAKTLIANALMPQVTREGIPQYLFGKGHGIELTIRGQVVGRQQRGDLPVYRTHSDFEIYGCPFNPNDDPSSKYDQLEGSEEFRIVMGNQEIFPNTNTKGLKNLPPDLLHETAELVNVGGIYFRVPELELQFVDKFMVCNEEVETRLRGMTDAECLATVYQLDAERIHALIDNYVISPVVAAFDDPEVVAVQNAAIFEKKVAASTRTILENNPEATPEEIAQGLLVDPVLINACENRDINDVSKIIDPKTGKLREDLSVSLIKIERDRQQATVSELSDIHVRVDAMLARVERIFSNDNADISR